MGFDGSNMLNNRKRLWQICNPPSAVLIISVFLVGAAQSGAISATVYSPEGVTPIGANRSGRLLVNSASAFTFEAGVTRTCDGTLTMNRAAV